MVLVEVRYNPSLVGDTQIKNICLALTEIIPAAFHCDEKPLSSGAVGLLPAVVVGDGKMHTAVTVISNVQECEELKRTFDVRTKELQDAMKELFRQVRFDFWTSIGPVFHTIDYQTALDPDVDMSMEATLERVRNVLELPAIA